jgi:hypothetical protein
MPSIVSFVKTLENYFFRFRVATLAVLLVFTLVMGWLAAQLHMTAGFDKQLPIGHEYIDTFFKYRTQLFGVQPHHGGGTRQTGRHLDSGVAEETARSDRSGTVPAGVDRRSVQSLWTPNTRVYELTEEGFNAEDVIGGNITPNALDAEKISGIRDRVVRGGYTGSLVANDGSAAMVVADLLEEDQPDPREARLPGPGRAARIRSPRQDGNPRRSRHRDHRLRQADRRHRRRRHGRGGILFAGRPADRASVYWYCRSCC